MVKRKQKEISAADGGVDTSEGFIDPHNYYLPHAKWKTIQVAKREHDLESSFSQVPRGQQSEGRVRRDILTIVEDNESLDESIVENRILCSFSIPHKPRNRRSTRKAEQSDSEVICELSPSYGRESRRRHHTLGKLDSGKFEFYMENVWKRFTEEKRHVFAYFDSLWFSLYTKGPLKEKVLSWIRRKDIFSKKYVFVPIVQWGHWFLLIFCHFGESSQSKTESPCMLLLDSLQEANSKQLEPRIRRFVFDIFKLDEQQEKKELIKKIPLLIPKVPQQKNGEGCGYFVLYYINLFLESAPTNFSFSNDYPHFMKEDWFTPEELKSFIETLDSTS